MTGPAHWFDVDRRGLAQVLERQGRARVLYELVANAWDADGVTRVEVQVDPAPRSPTALVTVRDDAPDGFADLSHAWTLFAESARKGDAGKRGRFNLGEKIVLALCDEARITTTSGTVLFDRRGRRRLRDRTERGSVFTGSVRATRAEVADMVAGLRRLLPPAGVELVVQGSPVPRRVPVGSIETSLLTEVADESGALRRRPRRCIVTAYDPLPGEPAHVYELGVPVVATGDRWDLDVSQKVPLNMERDNVTPAYLAALRTACANHLHDLLTAEDAASPLASDALASPDATPELVRRVLDLRYGEQRAVYDPSDREASMRLVSRGYAVIRGPELTAPQWENVRRHAAAEPAGRVDPTPRAEFSADGEDLWVPSEQWTPAMRRVVEYTSEVGRHLLGREIAVGILRGPRLRWAACFGRDRLTLNLGRLGHALFEDCLAREGGPGPTDRLNHLLIHELAHAYEGNHLDEAYHEALCRLGAGLARLALDRPALFRWERW